MLTVECTAANVLPFEHASKESHYNAGSESGAFVNAYTEAIEAQMKDDDDLPSLDNVLSIISSTPSQTSRNPTLPKHGTNPTASGPRKL